MEVYKDLISGTEYFSNAKPIKPVSDGKEEEKIDGLCYVETTKQAADGGAVDIGCGNEFGGAGEDEGADDSVETKLDQLLAFPDIQEDPIPFASFKQFRDDYFKPYMKALQKVKKDKGHFETKEDQKAFQTRMQGIMGWVKANFSSIDFYQANEPTTTNDEGKEVFNSLVFAHWAEGATTPHFCYIMDGYEMVKY
uniref:TCTP domain-containing protein n=2 Tax=Bicosoecida sp. CB-2014 TaxID=1486930 RepID=A0A7S1CG03_9STRA